MSLHGGNVKICKDTKLSGARGNVPSKPSMGGVKARHFITDVKPSGKGQWEIYKDLIDAEDDRIDNGIFAVRKRKFWMALSTLFSLMDKDKFEKGDGMAFTTAVTLFTQKMIEAWGENEITHYMVGIISSSTMYHIQNFLLCHFLLKEIIHHFYSCSTYSMLMQHGLLMSMVA